MMVGRCTVEILTAVGAVALVLVLSLSSLSSFIIVIIVFRLGCPAPFVGDDDAYAIRPCILTKAGAH